MNQPSNISEAARRAALQVLDGSKLAVFGIDEAAAIIQSALDSTHPAPKEGGAVETQRFFYGQGMHMPSFIECEKFCAMLELRLAETKRKYDNQARGLAAACDALKEKTREVEALTAQNKKGMTEYLELRDNYRRTCDAIDSLRTRLQQAEELLREAHGLIPRYDEYTKFSDRIATFLNSKKT